VSQPDQIQDGAKTEALADLSLTEEQADDTKGGSGLFKSQLSGEGTRVTIDL